MSNTFVNKLDLKNGIYKKIKNTVTDFDLTKSHIYLVRKALARCTNYSMKT